MNYCKDGCRHRCLGIGLSDQFLPVMIITIEGLGEIHSRVSTLLACCNNFKVVAELSFAALNLVIERTRLLVADRTLFCSKTANVFLVLMYTLFLIFPSPYTCLTCPPRVPLPSNCCGLFSSSG